MIFTLVYLARHGQTIWNVEGRWQGSHDIPLDETGLFQVEKLAEKVCRYNIEAIYSSPLGRAQVTAQACAKKLGLHVKSMDSLKELCLGVWEGLSFREISERYPNEFARWDNDPQAEVGMGVESNFSLQERARAALVDICLTERKDTLIVTHGGWMNRLLCFLLSIPLDKRMRIRLDNTGLCILDVSLVDEEPKIQVVTVNDYSHLCEK